jgi:WD40 repeat protein
LQPIWADESNTSKEKTLSKFPSFFPQRVSPKVLTNQESSRKLKSSPHKRDSDTEIESSFDENTSDSSSSHTEPEIQEKYGNVKEIKLRNPKQIVSAESSRPPDPIMVDPDNPNDGASAGGSSAGKNTPPKDFVCPITSNIFDDPVTLETGQTYERKAILEWINRGNSTCPITRQKLNGTQLPKTNYVLKRLIASWRDQNPVPLSNIASDKDYSRSTSPNSVISQATIEAEITNLCASEVLQESEAAVLRIWQFWQEVSGTEKEILGMLTKPPVINGFVEILFNSVDVRVLTTTVFLLSELCFRDKNVIHILTRVDSDVECIVALFKKGLIEAVVLIYLLRPSTISLVEMDVLDSILAVIMKEDDDYDDDVLKMCLNPKTASVFLLGQILEDAEENSLNETVNMIISGTAIENIVKSLESECVEERFSAVGILLRCVQEEGNCRNLIADKAELAPILESFIGANDNERFEIVQLLSELIKLNRRSFNEQVLHIIKDEGSFSTMHTLLIYLQTAVQDQCPVIAGLLLQLDLLAEPRKSSIYREDAIDTLISCLRNTENPSAQILAAETILSLQGRFSLSGKPLARAFLLKRAGLEKSYKSLIRKERQHIPVCGDQNETMEEEKAAEEWERKTAFVLVSHEFGLLFEALGEGIKSRYSDLCSACFLAATWLVHMLSLLPDTGLQGAARVCLLKRFVSIFKSSKDIEDRALSMLALSTFVRHPEGLQDLTIYMKDILKGLRELKKSSVVAFEMLKIFSEGNESSVDMWNHKELVQQDCSINGEVLSVICLKDKIFSGHSDGTIKVWSGKGSILHLIEENREHTKAVTSLAILQSGERLYSGSHDKTVRAWSIVNEAMHCEQVYDVKDHVNNLVVANSISCFIPHGAGVKVNSWNGASKLLNPNKNIKCLALVQGKLYCGCQDSSIQEIDLATGTLSSIQSGTRKLLQKSNPVQALQVHDGLVYAFTSSLDGAPLKIWKASNYSLVGSIATTMEVRTIAISSELIYLGCKGGVIEIWCKQKLVRKETLQTGTNSKIISMALDCDEDFLVIGTSDGRIQAWGLN